MKKPFRFSFTSIKLSQAYINSRRHMTLSPLPLNGIALLAVFTPLLHYGKQLSVQHKHWIMIVHLSVCLLFSIVLPLLFFKSLYLVFFSTCAGCMPGFRQGFVCSQPWQPATLLLLAPCPSILETSELFALLPYTTIPLQPDRSPKGQQTHPVPDRNTLYLLDPHLSRKGEALSVCKALGRRWRRSQGEQPLHNAISHFAALGHEIKRGIHCRSLK